MSNEAKQRVLKVHPAAVCRTGFGNLRTFTIWNGKDVLSLSHLREAEAWIEVAEGISALSEDGIGTEPKQLSDDDKGFIKGVAWGIALAARHHIGSDQMLMESGIPLKDFIAAGVLEHDLTIIRKLFKGAR